MRKPSTTDITDAPRDLVRPRLPPARAKNGCRPTDPREVLTTILYQTRAGVQWDSLPQDPAPRRATFDYYQRWSADGTSQRIPGAVRRAVRRQAGRAEGPTAAAIGSHSVKAAAGVGEGVGTDGGKRVRGRNRHLLTDTPGLVLCVAVTAADVSGGRAARAVLGPLALPDRASVRVVFADGRYHGKVCRAWFAGRDGMRLEVVGRPPGATGFVPVPKRWVVGRTFGWLVANRRCVGEYERRVWSSEARVKLAAAGMMLRRLRADRPAGYDNTAAAARLESMPRERAA